MHYYRFNIGDYASHTAHLDPIEDIAYRRMIDLYYLHEDRLPDDVNDIARLIRMRSHCDVIANVLREFFSKSADGWILPRADKDIAAYRLKSERARKSAEARWRGKAVEGNANALQPESERNANHKPLTINQEPAKDKGKKLTLDIKAMRAMRPHDVDKQIWDEYLQLRSRKKAEKTERAMQSIIKSLVDCMENGVSRQNMIEMCVEAGWKGVNYEWYKNKKGEGIGTSSREFDEKDYQAGAQTQLPPGW